MSPYIKPVYPSGNSLLSSLTSGFPRSIHGDLDGSVVRGYLGRICEHRDSQSEAFPCNRKKKKTNTLLLSKKIPEQVSRKANSSFLVELEHPARH